MISFSKPQVPKDHYYRGYDNKERWMDYWYQIDAVLNTGKERVLEVGIGNGVVSDYLRKMGLNVTTVDIDPELSPDYCCSVTELHKIFKPKSFDVSLCAEVLEHIPFECFPKSLNELSFVTKEYVIISLPYPAATFRFSLKLPALKEINFRFRIPLYQKHKFAGEHYWEIGKRNYPLRKILNIIEK